MTDIRAQSEELGVIFMVALAVIGAAALGIFAFGLLDDSTDGSTAERGVTLEYDAEAGQLIVRYTAGPETDKNDLYLRGDDPDGNTTFGSWATIDGSGTVTAGDSFRVPADGDESVSVVYEGEGTQKILREWEGPDR